MSANRFRRSGVILAIASVVGGAAVLGARPAQACEMYEIQNYVSPRRAERLLVAAARAANEGHGGRARAAALQVARAEGPPAAVRARAWAIAGWASWQGGERALAMRSFARARRLDSTQAAIAGVLAKATPSTSIEDLKKALAS